MNKVILIGRLTADPELRETASGKHACTFTVAVDRGSKDNRTADFIRCVAWHETGKFISNYFHKGNRIALEGNIKTGSYENEGRTVYTTDVWVDRVEFVESKSTAPTATPEGMGNINTPVKENAAQKFAERAAAANIPVEDISDFQEIISDGDLPF